MGNWIEKLVEHLVSLVWRLLASKVAARVEMELATAQAELLERAAAWRNEPGEVGEMMARRLESASAKLAWDIGETCHPLPDKPGVEARPAARLKSGGGDSETAPGKRSRGRPKKMADADPVVAASYPPGGNGEAVNGESAP